MMRQILLSPFIFISSLTQRLLAAAGAVIFAQFPSFLVQYIQRLGGHVDELSRIIKEYTAAAQKNNRTLEEYINLHTSSSVTDFAETGKIMSKNVERLNDLSTSLDSLRSSDILSKPFHFLKDLDMDMARSTAHDYVLSINITMESLLYAIIGITAVMIILSFIKFILKLFYRKIFSKKLS